MGGGNGAGLDSGRRVCGRRGGRGGSRTGGGLRHGVRRLFAWRGALGHDFGRGGAGTAADRLPPLLGVLGRVGPEGVLVGDGDELAERGAGDVLALYLELDAVEGADEAVWQEERGFRDGVAGGVVVGLELVQVLARRHDPVGGLVLFQDLGLALERAGDQGLRRGVVLVGKGNGRDGALGDVGVDEDFGVALDESLEEPSQSTTMA